MKKLAVLTMVGVLACSFMVGVLATELQAKSRMPARCAPSLLPPYCDPDTCKLYELYYCPEGLRYIWFGQYCC